MPTQQKKHTIILFILFLLIGFVGCSEQKTSPLDIPLMTTPGHSVEKTETEVRYTSGHRIDRILDYYDEELTNAGWKQIGSGEATIDGLVSQSRHYIREDQAVKVHVKELSVLEVSVIISVGESSIPWSPDNESSSMATIFLFLVFVGVFLMLIAIVLFVWYSHSPTSSTEM